MEVVYNEFSPNSIYDTPIIENIETKNSGFIESNDQIERYIFKTVQNIIDDVCIYNERINIIKARVEALPNENSDPEIRLQEELNNIPLRCVPMELKPDDPRYRNLVKVNLINEKGNQADVFGWCFMCRGPAKLYCKETRIPICSLECKKGHLEDLGNLISLKY